MKGCSNHDVKYSCIDKVQYSDNYRVRKSAGSNAESVVVHTAFALIYGTVLF